MECSIKTLGSSPILEPVSFLPPASSQPFIHAILELKRLLNECLNSLKSTDESSNGSLFSKDTSSESSVSSGPPPFELFFYELEQLENQDKLFPLIKQRREELFVQKETWRPFVAKEQGKDLTFYAQIEKELTTGTLIPHPSGAGGAYILNDASATPRFIIKPGDEDIFCLNNRKDNASPFNDSDHQFRSDIPLYRSAQTDALCWEIAQLAGLEKATPKAVLALIESPEFYDFTLRLNPEEKALFLTETGTIDPEKLCSVQEFIPDSQDLTELLHQFYAADLSDKEISACFDQTDFEEVCLFLWLIFDNDIHGANFRVFVKSIDATGKKIYSLKKVDNSLAFPEKNTGYSSILIWLSNALVPLSDNLKQKIANLPVAAILEKIDTYGLPTRKRAFIERLEILQTLSQNEGITLAEMDLRLEFLSRKEGKELALRALTTKQILELLGQETHSTRKKE